ncbi:MAG: PIN domain nuclease, partial [Anaerolineae bacterium]|nr:PIN domain nuclease [Anaerolineae bacterium]
MSVEFVFRLVGMVVFALLGTQLAAGLPSNDSGESARILIALTLAGAGFGLIIAPYLTTRPFLA